MNPFSLFARSKLKPSWTFSPSASIWRILFDPEGRIVGESRDRESKTMSFFCLDGVSGRVLWQDRRMKEAWWVGIEAVHRNTVFLHGFDKPDLPGHHGIVALDIETGMQRWETPDLTFWFPYGERVYAYKTMFERRIGYAIDLQTGSVLETYEGGIEELFGVRQLARKEEADDLLSFPQEWRDSGNADGIDSYVRGETKNKKIEGAIEYVFRRPCIIVSYHIHSRNSQPESLKLDNHLAIIDSRTGARIFSEIVSTDDSVPVPDSFFLRDEMVFLVKDHKSLQAVVLPNASEEESS